MGSIVITLPHSTGAGPHYSPLPLLGGTLAAGWLVGTNYHDAATGFGGAVTDDLSGNGNALTLHGAGPGATAMGCSTANWMSTALSSSAVFGPKGATLITVAASSTAGGWPEIGGLSISGTSPSLAIVASGAPDTLVSYNYPGGPQLVLDSPTPRDAAVFEFHAATFGPSGGLLYRRRAGFAAAELVGNGAAYTATSADPIRLGRSVNDGPFAGTGNLAMAMIAGAALTGDQLDAAYLETRALLAGFAVAI